MRKKLAALGLTAGLLGGGAAGFMLGTPVVSGAETASSTSATATAPEGGALAAPDDWMATALAPLVTDGTITQAQADAVVAALEAGIERGGASIDDYRDGRGEKGAMQDEFLVHTREGEPCPECGGPISRIVVSGRSTYYCPSCQVRLRRRPRAQRSGR